MNANNLQAAEYLDILFDGRNKDYGAYTIRRYYNNRLTLSLSIVIGISCFVFILSLLTKPLTHAGTQIKPFDSVITLMKYVDLKPPIEHTPVTPNKQIQFTAPLIVAIEITDPMPEVKDLDIATIALNNADGKNVEGNAPPAQVSNQPAVAAPMTEVADPKKIWITPEIPARFPGDWKRFLEKNLDYPELAETNETEGTVKLQFIVDQSGNISDILVLNDPGDGLADEAIRIIRRCPQWVPAEQNGQKVISKHFQTITFRLQ